MYKSIKSPHSLQKFKINIHIKVFNNLTLQKVAIVNGIIFPAVIWKGWLNRIINKIRFLAFLGSNLYHSRSYIVRCTALHLTNTYTYTYTYNKNILIHVQSPTWVIFNLAINSNIITMSKDFLVKNIFKNILKIFKNILTFDNYWL